MYCTIYGNPNEIAVAFVDDYSAFLRTNENGRIWLRLGDAIRLAAGYRPSRSRDGSQLQLLRASSNRIRADEKELLSAFRNDRLSVVPPVALERADGRFVDAREFLDWLSRCILLGEVPIPFPGDLARAVGDAVNRLADATGGAYFESLVLAIGKRFDRPLGKFARRLRLRVERAFAPLSWDRLDAERRRSVAERWDYDNDPANDAERKFWEHFDVVWEETKKEEEKWRNVPAPTARDEEVKEKRLAELAKRLGRLDRLHRDARGDYLPTDGPSFLDRSNARDEYEPVRYIPYPKAMKILADRLDATLEELAAWVWLGPENGGLAAFRNANELDSPPRFYFDTLVGAKELDYVSALMGCWFSDREIVAFTGAERYMTGAALIERWGEHPAIQPAAFIKAKIEESRLQDIHPICGGTCASNPGRDDFPPLEEGLFSVAEIEAIEREDFDSPGATAKPPLNSCPPATSLQIKQHFVVHPDAGRNQDWWSDSMRNARRNGLAACRVGAGGRGRKGSLWRPELIAAWLLDRHHKGKGGPGPKAVHAGLKKFPGCEEIADERFLPEQ